jgi:hypothetical protein
MVPRHIALELSQPERGVRFRGRAEPAIGVAVPETAMNEYHCVVLRQNHVGSAWQRCAVESKPEAVPVKK